MLDYAELFKDELGDSNNSLTLVLNKITELSTDSFQGTIISHSAKMTHPACKFPRIYAQAPKKSDGFVRTGNVAVDFDMHINATKLKVFKFLSLKIGNSTVYNLINENEVVLLAEIFSATEDLVAEWVHQFVKVINQQDLRSHSAIKQIFFPVENEYHQLSILTPSGLVFNLKNKIDHINDRSKEAYLGKIAKKNSEYLDSDFSFISGLTVTKHGGDHPKNISGLNNKYQSYYLLPSVPPVLNKRDIHFPQTDFFNQTVHYFQCKVQFSALHKLYKQDSNNMHVRAQRDEYYQDVIDHVIEKMWQIRGVALAQYIQKNSQLSAAQTTWLSDQTQLLRETTDDWLDDICNAITTFLFHGYEKVVGKKAIKLGDAEHKQMKKIVNKNKEALR
jgi:CRISPR-associated protein Csy1